MQNARQKFPKSLSDHDLNQSSQSTSHELAKSAVPPSLWGLFQTAWSYATDFNIMVLIFGFVPIVWPFLLLMGERGLTDQSNFINWYFWMNLAISAPHVYSTYLRFYRRVQWGETSSYWGWPAYLLCAAGLIVGHQLGYFLEVMTAVNIWQSFHYLRQTYGVHRHFLRSQTVRPTEIETRCWMWAFHLPMPLLILGRSEILYQVWQGRPSSFIIPIHIPAPIMTLCWALAAGGLALGIWTEWQSFAERPVYDFKPFLTFAVYLAVHGYGFLSVEHFQRGFFLVTVFHAIQYMGMVWIKDPLANFKQYRIEFTFVVALLLASAGSIAFDRLIFAPFSTQFVLVASALLSGLSVHHYLIDTLIWKRAAQRS